MQGKSSIGQTVRYLNNAFARAARPLGSNNTAGTDLHKAQTEFCYFIDEIQRGPSYMTPKIVTAANEFIDKLNEANR